MKALKPGILNALMVCMLAAIPATAGTRSNSTDMNNPYFEHDQFLINEDGYHDGKVVNLDTSGQHGLEVKPTDEPNAMTWDAAILAVKKHGPGWRLPTIAELGLMYEQRKYIGDFSAEDYWSSKEQDVNSAWIQGFRLGDQDRYNKQSKLRVRAVRSF